MEFKLGLSFYSSEVVIFNPIDLDKKETREFIKNNKYHVYMVCKRKKIFFEKSEIVGSSCQSIFYYLDDKHNKIYLNYKHPNSLVIHGHEDGYYDVDFGDKKNQKVRDFLMISNFTFLEDDLIGNSVSQSLPSDLEVMYIGQAFGRTTLKTIDYRISHHEKVQKIALDILDKGSNEEVLIIGLKIKTNDMAASIVKINSGTKAPTTKELKELVKKAQRRIKEGQEITVFEASLIKYFRPDLNTEYKETFPSVDYPSYEEIFKTDFDYSAMTIDTRPIFSRVYSKHISERKYIHSQHYPLTSKSDKKSLFEYLYELSD